MSLRISAAHSSRVRKPKPQGLKRSSSSSSPFSSLPRRKPIQRSKSKPDTQEQEFFEDRLDDLGLVKALATDLTLRDVPQAIKYIKRRMFCDVPQQSSGMNSTRIAEVLDFHRSLPPVVTVTHIEALLNSPTAVEREIAELTRGGIIRKIVVPSRGTVGEALVLVGDLESMIENNNSLSQDVKHNFISVLRELPAALKIPRQRFSATDAKALMHAGFITTAIPNWTSIDVFSRPGDGSWGTLTSIHAVSRAASGSLAAVGGDGAVHAAGGSGGGFQTLSGTGDFTVALPTMGPYLKLLTNARAHILSLLSKSKFREVPEDFLREKWDGGISADDAAAESKKSRGEFVGVLPGRTRKWKQFYGVSFEWVLEECVGAGMIEVFDTRSVGRGIRAI